MSDSLSSRALAKVQELRKRWHPQTVPPLLELPLAVVEAVARWKCPVCGGTGERLDSEYIGPARKVPCACAPIVAALEEFCK